MSAERSTAAAIDLLLTLVANAGRISTVIRQAQSEGREPTSAELVNIARDDDGARAALVDAIARAKAEGR